MQLAAYRDVLAVREARAAMLLGLLIRVPMFAATVVLTIHIVSTLGESYGAAGVATTVATVALAISGPWRGRLLDRIGLRRTLAPSIVAQALCWSVAPFVSYGPLLVLAGLAALLAVPTFMVVRQVIIAHVPKHQRRSALSLDSASTELSFMIGSMVGGLGYGAWHRSISPFWLLLGLAAATAPVALAPSIPVFAVLLLLAGRLCAPTITATVGGAVAVACLLARAQSSDRRQSSARWRRASI